MDPRLKLEHFENHEGHPVSCDEAIAMLTNRFKSKYHSRNEHLGQEQGPPLAEAAQDASSSSSILKHTKQLFAYSELDEYLRSPLKPQTSILSSGGARMRPGTRRFRAWHETFSQSQVYRQARSC